MTTPRLSPVAPWTAMASAPLATSAFSASRSVASCGSESAPGAADPGSIAARTGIRASRRSALSAPTSWATNALAGRVTSSSGLPTWTARPVSITTILLARRSASSTSWVTKRIVCRISRWIRRSSSWRRVRVIASSAPNGSSIRRVRGSAAIARARPTRCCSPPDNCVGYRREYRSGGRPTRSSRWRTRSFTCALRPLQQLRHHGDVVGHAHVRERAPPAGSHSRSCRRNSGAARERMSVPSITISPEVGSISRLTILSRVVLPLPDVPEQHDELTRRDFERHIVDRRRAGRVVALAGMPQADRAAVRVVLPLSSSAGMAIDASRHPGNSAMVDG